MAPRDDWPVKTVFRILIPTVGAIALVITGICAWLFFYVGDLPDFYQLSRFAPNAEVIISNPCLGKPSTVIPFNRIGKALRDALAAAEPTKLIPRYIARDQVGCNQKGLRPLRFQLNELRLSWHIRRHFSDDQIFTIYANQAYFGAGANGVKSASLAYFHKDPDALSIADAALLAGLLRSPERFSPYKHPDRALQRRNEVLRAMVAQGTITANEAANAEKERILTQ